MWINPFVRGIRCDADTKTSRARRIEERNHAGKDRLAQEQFILTCAPFELQCRAIRVRTESMPRIERILRMPDAPQKEHAVKRYPMAKVNLGISIDERRFGIENQSVKIKDEGADHGLESSLAITSAGAAAV